MLRDFFHSVTGYEYFGMISTSIFMVFFIMVIIHAWTLKKDDAEKFGKMPLDDSTRESKDV